MQLTKFVAGAMGAAAIAFAPAAQANEFEHVLLISVDGLHALDVLNYVEANPTSALAGLSHTGFTYTNARTPSLSDSFPGLLALLTGGSPISHGMFYDVSYDRSLFDASNTNCAGAPGSPVIFDESIDNYDASGVSLNTINPAALPRGIRDGKCVPIYPHDAIKSNTIFEVVKAHGGRTAWADKHPAYDLVNGPSGKGVDDLYTPEITNATDTGPDATASVLCTVANDKLKVDAIVNEIDGKSSLGKQGHGMPTLLGMNFQAVSVGQKLAKDKGNSNCLSEVYPAGANLTGLSGGYVNGAGVPSKVLQYGLDKTDAAIGRIVEELKKKGKYESTLIVVSAKHGQSPINPAKVNKAGHFADLVAGLPDASSSSAAGALASAAACSSGACGFVQDDDVALIWLQDQSQTAAVADYLNQNAHALFIDEVLSGASLRLRFNDPAGDNKTPDIIVQPQYGTVYTASAKKNAEHGGQSFEDTNVGLIVSSPRFDKHVIKTPVTSSQVAPTVLRALGIDPDELKGARQEHTDGLPGMPRH